MKLAKTLLACVVTLALIGTMAVAAFAATPEVTITVDKASVAIGDEVTVTVALKNATGAEDGAIRLAYDGAILNLKSVGGNDNALGSVAIPAKDEEFADCDAKGVVKNSFAITSTLEDDDAHVVYVAVFTAKAAGSVAFALTESYVTIAGEEAALTGATASVAVSETTIPDDTTTTAPVTDAPATDAAPTTTAQSLPKNGDAGIAAIAGLVVLAGAAFVATKKKSK